MNSPTLVHRFGAGESHPTYASTFRSEDEAGVLFTSSGVTVVVRDGRGAELHGFITTARQFGEIRYVVSADERALRHIECACLLDDYVLQPGESVSSETLLVLHGDDPRALIEAYASAVSEEMHTRVPPRSPSGWCSWYPLLEQGL